MLSTKQLCFRQWLDSGDPGVENLDVVHGVGEVDVAVEVSHFDSLSYSNSYSPAQNGPAQQGQELQ